MPVIHILIFAAWIGLVYGFSFVVSPPTECDPIQFTWDGGQPPFRVIIIPPGGTLRNISIPASAFDGHSGNFSTPFNLPEGSEVVYAMEDATGAVAGGGTPVLVVGPSVGRRTCDTTIPRPDFVFSLDRPLAQCQQYSFTLYADAVQPITILVTVPHGESFLLRPPIGDSFNWKANLTAGTPVIFSMTDSRNRTGGTSEVKLVGPSNDDSCISDLLPFKPPGTWVTPKNSPPTDFVLGENSRNKAGAAASAVVGGLGSLGIIVGLYFFLIHKRKQEEQVLGPVQHHITLSPFTNSQQRPISNPFPLSHDAAVSPVDVSSVPLATTPVMVYQNEPLTGPNATPARVHSRGTSIHKALPEVPQRRHHITPSQQSASTTGSTDSGMQESSSQSPLSGRPSMSDDQSRFSLPSRHPVSEHFRISYLYNKLHTGQRIIVHTDIDDMLLEEELPIELPPQYSEGRTPIPGMPLASPPPPPTKGVPD